MNRVERQLNESFDQICPDFDHILETIEQTPVTPMQIPDSIVRQNVPVTHHPLSFLKEKTSGMFSSLRGRSALAYALSFLLIVSLTSGFFINRSYVKAESLIAIDVNPSLELVTNKKNKVTKVIGKNEDAAAIIDDMNLKNVDLNIAVNALIGSMLKHGYLQDDENTVLVSVSSRDQKKAKQIQNDIEEDFTSSLAVIDKEATVIKQDIVKDSSLSKQSSEYGISEGKMQFINELLALDPSLNSNVLAAMSINELASLAKQYHMIPETDTSPSPSITGTTTEEKREDKKKPASADSDPEDSKKEENADNVTSDEETDDTEDSDDEDFPDEEDDDSSSGKIDQKSDTTEAPSSPNTINEDEEPDTNNDQTNRPITLD